MSDKRIGLILFVAGAMALLATEPPVGFGRDESVYFYAAENHARWFQLLLTSPQFALTDSAITQHFDFNHEHPALMKNLFGISYWVFHQKLAWLRPAAAFRLPAFLLAALTLPLIYSLSRRLFGRMASIFAAVSFFLIPRQFFHSHLACFDVPIATLWLLTVYGFVKAQEKPRWWLYTGLFFGAALGAKHNAYFIPAALLPLALWKSWALTPDAATRQRLFAVWGVLFSGASLFGLLALSYGSSQLWSTFEVQSPQTVVLLTTAAMACWSVWQLKRLNETVFRLTAPFVAMAILGPVIFYLHWPYLWHHPIDRTLWYLSFHLNHNHYTWFYLGELLRSPPFPLAYVVVKTALTVPTSIFLPMVLGFVAVLLRMARRRASFFEWIVVVNAVLSIALISHPQVPHFGGVKHWFPSMPFLAILAAGSLERGAMGLHEWLSKWSSNISSGMVTLALLILVGSPAALATGRIFEFGTSAYSELAGGLPGAASLGMQRQYWANNLSGVLPWLNAHVPTGARVYFHENHGGQIRDNQRNGMLRTDIVAVGSPSEADYAVYQYHQEFREQEFNIWQAFDTQRPVYGLYLDETPQIVIYQRQHR